MSSVTTEDEDRVETRLKQSVASSENWRDERVRAKRVRSLKRAWRRRLKRAELLSS
jgi:hypothetical protein